MEWLNIAKVGTWTAKNGQDVTLSESDFDRIVQKYNPKEKQAPLVIGHPSDNHPAFGWVEGVRRAGEFLQARFEQIHDGVKKAVSEKLYKKISMALYPDGTLRHVGLLGAVPPAISGLGDVKFSEGVFNTIEFSEGNEMEKTIEELKAQLTKVEAEKQAALEAEKQALIELSAQKTAIMEKTIETRINELVAENRILPDSVPVIKSMAFSLAESKTEIEFSAGVGKKPLIDHLFDFLKGLPDRKMFNEFSAPGNREDDKFENLTGKI